MFQPLLMLVLSDVELRYGIPNLYLKKMIPINFKTIFNLYDGSKCSLTLNDFPFTYKRTYRDALVLTSNIGLFFICFIVQQS